MAHQYVFPADKLARLILKAATKEPPSKPLTISIIASWFDAATAVDIRVAVAHAIDAG